MSSSWLVHVLAAVAIGSWSSNAAADEETARVGQLPTDRCEGIYRVEVTGVPFDRVYRDTVSISDIRRDFTFHHRYIGSKADEICSDIMERLSPISSRTQEAEWATKMVRVVFDFVYIDKSEFTVFATAEKLYSENLKRSGKADCRLHMLVQTIALMPKAERDRWVSVRCGEKSSR